MEATGLGGDENAGKRLTVLRAIDKLDRLGVDEIEKLLGPGRKDDSGDFTKGAELNDVQITRIINFTGWGERGSGAKSIASANEVTIANFETAVEGNALGEKGVEELTEIRNVFAAAGYDDGRIVIDPSVVRGLEYYTGPVYEVELIFEINDDKGRPVRFGSVGGGGRYDGLVSRFMGQPVPATGFSIGVSRLQAALTALGKLATKPEPGPVLVTIMDRDNIAAYQGFVSQLRKANIRAELYLGNPKNNLGQQLKYADRRSSPCAIIQGSNEKTDGKVVIRDLVLGAELAAENASEREDYLKKQAEAQFSVNEADLVDAVRKLLARHKPA
jgi:histidyl-tRNA synthetase